MRRAIRRSRAGLSDPNRPVGSFLSTTDISGGAFVSYDELQAAYPGVPTSQVRIIDGNKDGRISAVELAAGQADLSVYEAGGSSILGILLIIFIVFVITDVIGATDIFPFIHPVK